MTPQVVLVHGIRSSATMWRQQLVYLAGRGVPATAVDLPGHGPRVDEPYTLDGAFATIRDAVDAAAARGPVLLVGHSMGGILSAAYLGSGEPTRAAGFLGACCTSLPKGPALAAYRAVGLGLDRLPDGGRWVSDTAAKATLPRATHLDPAAGGYADHVRDDALRSLGELDLRSALPRISVPTWFVNGQFDQLRINERLFTRLVPDARLTVVPRTSHMLPLMQPVAFDRILDQALGAVAKAA